MHDGIIVKAKAVAYIRTSSAANVGTNKARPGGGSYALVTNSASFLRA
jgi:hypothetical protein